MTVLVDRNRIQQVLTHLIANACKYGPEGQPIDLIIHDAGGAIPPEEQGRIFERFYRSGNQTLQPEGAGLGLAICRSLIELHEGKIWVSSSHELGTSFTFTLPKVREPG